MVREGRRHLSLRLIRSLLPLLGVTALLAGCGGNEAADETTTTPTVSAAANTAYERSYSDCASKQLKDLAHQYAAKQNKRAVAIAVGKYWAKRAGGGANAAELGRTGCLEGFAFGPK